MWLCLLCSYIHYILLTSSFSILFTITISLFNPRSDAHIYIALMQERLRQLEAQDDDTLLGLSQAAAAAAPVSAAAPAAAGGAAGALAAAAAGASVESSLTPEQARVSIASCLSTWIDPGTKSERA